MLSRVAECLYWMSRSIERIENIARIVDVNTQLMLDLPTLQAEKLSGNWTPLVMALGDDVTFRKLKRAGSQAGVIDFMVFDRDNPNSILGCLSSARENARTVREQISTEMWGEINRFYLWITSKNARMEYEKSAYDFFQHIKESCHRFRGTTDATMSHDEGWDFIQMGLHIERTDKTSRILDDEFYLLGKLSHLQGAEQLQLNAVLRSCSARLAYQRLYASVFTPVNVAEFLLLSPDFPRSVLFNVRSLDEALRRISGAPSGTFSNTPEKLSGRLLADLRYSEIADYLSRGLHQTMDELQLRLNSLGEAIAKSYMHQAEPAILRSLRPMKKSAAQSAQQQQ
ncbi:MAG: alpha-E domain-containing protein [Verrucomicrobiae bacterium]|nr:alpha-E domain-containing protein [Verrucomicrobiae bacterium]